MKKKIGTFLSLFLWLICLYKEANADVSQSYNSYNIEIVKYKIANHASLPFEVPSDGTQADVSNVAEGLTTMSGVSYEVTRVTPKENSTDLTNTDSYQRLAGKESFSETIITDLDGVAKLSGLTEGTYIVSEQANNLIKNTMTPVLIKLPLYVEGEIIDTVYIYPKSNVINSNEEGNGGSFSSITNIPQTSGELGTKNSIIVMITLVVVMGIFGIYNFKRKKV